MSALWSAERNLIFGRSVVGFTIMDVVYGIQVTGSDDSYITIAEEVVYFFGLALLPGRFLVDMLPLRASRSLWLPVSLDSCRTVRYVPGWFPGAGFQNIAELTRRLSDKLLEDPMRVVEARMVCACSILFTPHLRPPIQNAGGTAASMTSYLLEEAQNKRWSNERKSIKDVVGVSYAGPSPTMTLWFYLIYAMVN